MIFAALTWGWTLQPSFDSKDHTQESPEGYVPEKRAPVPHGMPYRAQENAHAENGGPRYDTQADIPSGILQ